MPSGALLELLADDPASAKDVPAFCEMTGDTLEQTRQDGDTFVFHIRKA
jgi:TusA-related sulfurtransferase